MKYSIGSANGFSELASQLGDLAICFCAFASHSYYFANQLDGFANHFSGLSNASGEKEPSLAGASCRYHVPHIHLND